MPSGIPFCVIFLAISELVIIPRNLIICVGSVSSAAVFPVAAVSKSWYLRINILRFPLGFCFIWASLKAECALDFSSVKHLLSSLQAISHSMSTGKLLIIHFTWALAHPINSTLTSLWLTSHKDSIWYNQSSNESGSVPSYIGTPANIWSNFI